MKSVQFFIFLLTSALVVSCQSNINPKVSENQTKTEIKTPSKLSNMKGFWIETRFFDALQSGKNFAEAQSIIAGELTSLNISDTIVSVGYGFHEGQSCVLKPIDEKHFELLNKEGNLETLYKIEKIDETSFKADNKTYKKIGTSEQDVATLDYFLVGGEYTLEKGNTSVSLKADGSVVGLEKYNHYTLLYDYTGETKSVNQIAFNNGENIPDYFAFERKDKVFSIYNLKCLKKSDGTCIQNGKGSLKWILKF